MCQKFLAGLLLLICAPLFAQTLGEITGEVKDSSGAVVSGATVTAANQSTNATRTAVSNDAGVYSFPALQPGVYNLKVERAGFRTVTQNNVELQVQQTARIDFNLQVGQVNEVVEVSASSALLTTENATVGTVIENKRIVELPLNGRNFLQLVALSPNVSAGFAGAGQSGDRQGGTRSEQQLSISGMRREFNYFTLDGIDNTDVNFNTYIFLPSIDALQEFKVQTGIYPAEFGREASQINVSTKSGTNNYHGALFEFLRNNVLDAKPYAFTSSRPNKAPFKWNQYGFTLGGPVSIPKLFNGRDRLFFMTNFEGYRDRKQFQNIYSVPSAAMRGGNFSELLPKTTIRDPGTGLPFSGNVIPTDRITATSQKLLEFYPAPNVNTSALSSNYLALDNRTIDKDQFSQRVDFVENAKSSWFGRYSWEDEQQVTPALKLNGTNLLTKVKQYMISNTRVFSPTVVNEFRFGYNSFFNSQGRELAFTRDVVGELKLPGLGSPPPVAWGIPAVGIQGFSGFGDSSEGPYENRNHTFQWVDNISWIRGTHSFRFGGEIRRDRYNQLGNQFARGSFIFENQATGYSFSDFLLGYPRQDEQSLALAVAQFRATSQAYYIDDTWKVRPTLTITLGLRYEYTPPWSDKGKSLVNMYVPFIDTTPNVQDPNRHPTFIRTGSGDFYQDRLFRFIPAIKTARDGRMGDRLVASDKNDFAPRLGIAWSPTSKWTIRTGVGVFYVQDTGNPRFDMERNLAVRNRVVSNSDRPDITWANPFQNTSITSVNPCGNPPPLVCASAPPYVLANIYGRRTPYSIQYLFNIQREIGHQTSLEVGYLGSVSHKLERLRAFNEALPGTTGSVVSRTPYPELGRIQEVDGSVNANYNSLEAKLQRRFSAGLTFLTGYTWSKSIDTGSGIRVLGSDPLFPQNSYCIRCERGLSVFDARHRFVSSALYDLPLGKGKRFLSGGGISNVLFGGWELSSIVTLSSGFPLNVYAGPDRSNVGGTGADRPNSTGKNAKLQRGEQDPQRFFDTSAFVLEPLGTFGNTGRNTLIGPGIIEWDFSTLKHFRFTETKELQFRFEAFNFPNHPNWGDPNATLSSNQIDQSTGQIIPGTGNFGKITGTRNPMRELQFGLKLIF